MRKFSANSSTLSSSNKYKSDIIYPPYNSMTAAPRTVAARPVKLRVN